MEPNANKNRPQKNSCFAVPFRPVPVSKAVSIGLCRKIVFWDSVGKIFCWHFGFSKVILWSERRSDGGRPPAFPKSACNLLCPVAVLLFLCECGVHRNREVGGDREVVKGPRCCVTPRMLGNPRSEWLTFARMNVDSGMLMWSQAATVCLGIFCTNNTQGYDSCASCLLDVLLVFRQQQACPMRGKTCHVQKHCLTLQRLFDLP